MIKCKECGKEINTKAEICPHCGCRVKSNTLKIALICILVIAIIIGGYFAIKTLIRLKQQADYNEEIRINSENIDNYKKVWYLDLDSINESMDEERTRKVLDLTELEYRAFSSRINGIYYRDEMIFINEFQNEKYSCFKLDNNLLIQKKCSTGIVEFYNDRDYFEEGIMAHLDSSKELPIYNIKYKSE